MEKLVSKKQSERQTDIVVRNKWETKKFSISNRVKVLAENQKEFESKQQKVMQTKLEMGKMIHLRKELLTKKHDIKMQFVQCAYSSAS